MMSKKIVILLSGGLDSATALAVTKSTYPESELHTLSFNYGQKQVVELNRSRQISAYFGCNSHLVVPIALDFRSALTEDNVQVPKNRSDDEISSGVPSTYVPGRNIIFLAIAASRAETIGAGMIVTGFNQIDYSGYPDCRTEFVVAFQRALDLGTDCGEIMIATPLIMKTKSEIIRMGVECGVDYSITISCYDPVLRIGEDIVSCGKCDSCIIRRKGFEEAQVPDPTIYA